MDHFHWIYSRGLLLRTVVALFMLWNVAAFPGRYLPHAWAASVLLLLLNGAAWLARHHRYDAVLLWAILTSACDMLVGVLALMDFSQTALTNAPALLPLVGIELIAYWGWVGHWIALGYSTLAIVSLWSFPIAKAPHAFPTNQTIFWLVVNLLLLSSVAVLLHASPIEGSPFGLTVREREVYRLLKEGNTQREIAERLHIERSTVKTHVQHIHRKLGTLHEDDPN